MKIGIKLVVLSALRDLAPLIIVLIILTAIAITAAFMGQQTPTPPTTHQSTQPRLVECRPATGCHVITTSLQP